jgi:peptidoglycan/xylan/chitin deacetylase (PgdA/CDA1 family)
VAALVSVLRSLANGPRVRGALARSVSASGAFAPLQRVLGRVGGGLILAFHNLPAARFVEHVESLAPDRPVALDELVERQRYGRSTAGLFAITFDDGVGATVRAIADVALARGWPVTFYVPTGYVDDPLGMPFQWLKAMLPHLPAARVPLASGPLDLSPPGAVRAFRTRMSRTMYTRPRAEYAPLLRELADYLIAQGLASAAALAPPAAVGWDEIARLARDPLLRFESHGVSHVALSALDGDALERELRESRDAIQEHSGRPCRHFCYPFGSAESIGAAAAAMTARYYVSAVTMTRGRLRHHAPYLLPRIPLYPEDDAAVARLKVLTL